MTDCCNHNCNEGRDCPRRNQNGTPLVGIAAGRYVNHEAMWFLPLLQRIADGWLELASQPRGWQSSTRATPRSAT